MIYLAIFLAALAQVTIFSSLNFFDAAPNLVLVTVVLWLSRKPKRTGGLLAVIIGGLLLDFLSGDLLGVNTLALLTVFLFMRLLAGRSVQYENIFLLSLMLLILTFVFNAARIFVFNLFVFENGLTAFLPTLKAFGLSVFLKESVYNIIILNLFILASKFKRRKSN